MQPCHCDFSTVTSVLDFWLPEWWENQFLLLCATKFVVIWCSCPRKWLPCTLLFPLSYVCSSLLLYSYCVWLPMQSHQLYPGKPWFSGYPPWPNYIRSGGRAEWPAPWQLYNNGANSSKNRFLNLKLHCTSKLEFSCISSPTLNEFWVKLWQREPEVVLLVTAHIGIGNQGNNSLQTCK